MANSSNILNASKSLRSAGIVFLISVFLQLLALIVGLAPSESYERVRVVILIIGIAQLILSILFAINLLITSGHLEGGEKDKL